MFEIKSAEFVTSVFDLKQFKGRNLPEIAFAGRSNVGKSSMLNKIMGRKNLAKTSQTPGKTRSINYFLISNKAYFVDLPGYGYAKVSKKMREDWGQLMDEYFDSAKNLCGVIQLVDSRHEPTALDLQMHELLDSRGIYYMIVLTKADKLSTNQLIKSVKGAVKKFELPADLYPVPFSAIKGTGKKEVLTWIDWRITNCKGNIG
jgi:GTP-binding protein